MTDQLEFLPYVYLCPLCNSATATWQELVDHFFEHHSTDCKHTLVGKSDVRVVKSSAILETSEK